MVEKYEFLEKIYESDYSIFQKVKKKETEEILGMKMFKLSGINSDEKENLLYCIAENQEIEREYFVKIYEFFEDENYIYIVTELYQGTLQTLFDKKKRIFR